MVAEDPQMVAEDLLNGAKDHLKADQNLQEDISRDIL